ncbi:hypothetical protein [Acinetobacter sp.]|uniref:hypothetical protein n=1 Tax=Acinetobacter sp. TaxID=472 RepID=UPI003D0818FD
MDLIDDLEQMDLAARARKLHTRLLYLCSHPDEIPDGVVDDPFFKAFRELHTMMGADCQFLVKASIKLCQNNPGLVSQVI